MYDSAALLPAGQPRGKQLLRSGNNQTFISTTQDTTVILKSIQYFIRNVHIAAISPSYGPT